MAIFFQVPKINGDSTDSGFANFFNVEAFSWGEASTVSIGSGISGKATPSQITIERAMSKGSLALFEASVSGMKFDTITFAFTKSSSSGAEFTFLQIILKQALIVGYQVSSSGGAPQESISIAFAEIDQVFFYQPYPGLTLSEKANWNFATNMP